MPQSELFVTGLRHLFDKLIASETTSAQYSVTRDSLRAQHSLPLMIPRWDARCIIDRSLTIRADTRICSLHRVRYTCTISGTLQGRRSSTPGPPFQDADSRYQWEDYLQKCTFAQILGRHPNLCRWVHLLPSMVPHRRRSCLHADHRPVVQR